TGQHYDEGMSDVFFRELHLPEPDANLGVGSGRHGEQTAAMLIGLEAELLKVQPDWVLLYGDTNSTLAGAIAAAKLNIKIAHIEAGLRSYNRTMPEEINRLLTDHVSTLLFCPTQMAVENLKKEGMSDGVFEVGDVMVDGLLAAQENAQTLATVLQEHQLRRGTFYLATIHRPVNTDSRETLSAILRGFEALAKTIVLPAHPRLQAALKRENLPVPGNVKVIPPASYLNMVALLDAAALVITDSGGLQKEAYIMHRPCITVRTETEWVETVESGWNQLAKPDSLLHAVQHATRPHLHPDFYGDGKASQRIVNLMADYGG
ncbi:MAG: UDP-N-acetylglucosamine 2-epimerase (non-hydrolyzing), partial [Anaerolineae bacterium]|nr:UDP-N-acetylglucosamine 2-epimerase (non-hydrolyzing) [Anaerolineae bacterium]